MVRHLDDLQYRSLLGSWVPHDLSDIAKLARNKIKSLDWELLPHPPYSPDLAPSDYHLFRHLKAEISGQHFGNFEDLESWLETFFDDKPRIFYDRGIRKLLVKWAEVVEHDGEYTV